MKDSSVRAIHKRLRYARRNILHLQVAINRWILEGARDNGFIAGNSLLFYIPMLSCIRLQRVSIRSAFRKDRRRLAHIPRLNVQNNALLIRHHVAMLKTDATDGSCSNREEGS